MAEGVHFLPGEAPEDIGWKALAVNVSDLVARATPLVYLMSLAFPAAPAADGLAGLARGLAAAQASFGISLAGGDTDRRPGPFAITIAALGTVPTGKMVRRGTARVGDRLVVSGTLGDAVLGLELRRRQTRAQAWGLAAGEAASLVACSLRPQPPLALIEPLRAFAHAAMDISDGLAKDLGRMAKASGVAARVSVSALPLSAAARALAADPSLVAEIVTGGEDYQVLAAVAPSDVAAFLPPQRRADRSDRDRRDPGGDGGAHRGPGRPSARARARRLDHFEARRRALRAWARARRNAPGPASAPHPRAGRVAPRPGAAKGVFVWP